MKQEEINNIEDLLELSAGLLHSDKSIKLDTSDMTIMYSIARQTFKGTALTDRQHALMSEKLVAYRAQFIEAGVDFDKSINELRQPIRQIDRSKYIKICKPGDAIPLKQMDHNIEWIKIRFPFSKKLIVLLEEVKAGTRQDHHYHERGSHEHYFALNDRTISLIVPRFINKEFDIDQELIDQYNKFKSVSLFDFHPYYDGELHNINDSLREQITKETDLDYNQIVDRRHRYGLHIQNLISVPNTGIVSDIIKRKTRDYLSNPKEQSFKQIMDALSQLDRFPLMVILNDKRAEHQLYEFWDYFRYKIPPEEQSVMFRLDNEYNSDFNQFITEKKLNNKLDKNTKIVYINKINKVILKSEWTPIAAFAYDSHMDRNLSAYIYDACDLIIFREENTSPFRMYSRLYG